MAKDPINPMKEEKRRLFHDLFLWLALIPLIFGSLFACGQLALILVPEEAGAITRSLLKADYLPWAYNLIPPINVEAFIQDVVKEQQLFGPTGMPESTAINELFLIPPTPTNIPVSTATQTETPEPEKTRPPSARTTPTITNTTAVLTPTLPLTLTATASPSPTKTRTRLPGNRTSTPTDEPDHPPQPTRTRTPSPPTLTNTAVIPTRTHTPVLPTVTRTKVPNTPTHTVRPPTATKTFTPVAASKTPTVATKTPVVTQAPVATNTPVTPEAKSTPTSAPVRPIAENKGASEKDLETGGCKAYFGYQNDNPMAVTIPLGELNFLSVEADTSPGIPTGFKVGRVAPAFTVVWTKSGSITWTLNGRKATARWCQ